MSQPIDCTLGETCFIQQYVDSDPGPGAADFTCGTLSYDGHKGTDFALPSLAAMRKGVNVLAAAPGTVTGLRDEMPDINMDSIDAPALAGRECGNGLVISHGGGWETQYCHMKRGTLSVKKGQRVAKGTVLGQVGLSGKTQFPHLHLSVRQDGKVVDPFAADGIVTCQAPSTETLWQTPLPYQPGGLINAGFDDDVPRFADLQDTPPEYDMVPSDTRALVFWALVYGAQKGDEIEITIVGPDGPVFTHRVALPKTQARLFRALGQTRPAIGWMEGQYFGSATLLRDGQEIDRMQKKLVIRP